MVMMVMMMSTVVVVVVAMMMSTVVVVVVAMMIDRTCRRRCCRCLRPRRHQKSCERAGHINNEMSRKNGGKVRDAWQCAA